MGQAAKYLLKNLLTCWLLALSTSSALAVEIGAPAPDFTLRTFSGQQFSHSPQTGRPLLLVFWNTWCVNCQRELGELDRLDKLYGAQGLVILAVNTGINDSEEKARNYLQQRGHSFAAGFDRDFSLGTAYGVRGVPTICLIDAAGVVRYQQAGLPDDLAKRLGLSLAFMPERE